MYQNGIKSRKKECRMSNHLRTLGKLAAAAAAVLIMLVLFACSGSYRILSEKQTERMAARNA